MPLTTTGFQRRTFDEILSAKIQKAKELFGEDIDTSDVAVLGKILRINAYDQNITEEETENIYYSLSPTTATGQSLDRVCWRVGISRNPATAAEYVVTVVGEVGTKVPLGFLVGTESGLTYYSVSEATIGDTGTVDIVVSCTEVGEIGNVAALDIIKIINPVANITSVHGMSQIEVGEEVESDYALRLRYSAAREGSGSCSAAAIRAALMRIPTVESVSVATNETNETDASGRPARSFECYIAGGEDYEDEIAATIFDKKPIGIKTHGSITKTVTDEGGYTHDVSFSHTSEVVVHVRITINTSSEFNETSAQEIKNNLREQINNLAVGKSVIVSTLYAPIHAVNGVSEVVELKLSNNEQTWMTKNIDISAYQKAIYGGLYIRLNDETEYTEVT